MRCVSDYLREAADKIAMPHVSGFDFYFEFLDDKSRDDVIDDFESGETIHIPSLAATGPLSISQSVSKGTLPPKDEVTLSNYMRQYKGKHIKNNGPLKYDLQTHSYAMAD